MTLYDFPCLLLSGMPCTGKDTLSHRLTVADPTFVLFRKHRAATTHQDICHDDSYIHVSPEEFERIAISDGFLQCHQRYGKRYGVSRQEYQRLTEQHKIPVIHVGKYENLKVLRHGGLQQGLSVLLWTDRTIVHSRLLERHASRHDGVEERLIAYDQEIAQLQHYHDGETLDFDLIFVNNGSDPDHAVYLLLSALQSHRGELHQYNQKLITHLLGNQQAGISF